jgi:hypothetical protein
MSWRGAAARSPMSIMPGARSNLAVPEVEHLTFACSNLVELQARVRQVDGEVPWIAQ